jgi:hypothetical protein
MTDNYDPIPDLAALVWAAVYGDPSAPRRAEALLPMLGIGGDDSASEAAIETGLRKALGPAASGADAELDEILTLAYACTRVWEAWQYGTMTEEDFTPAAETEIRDELITWRDAAARAALEGAPQGLADRVADVLSEAGYTDARQVFPGGFLITGGPGYATTGSVIVSVPWTDATDAERRRLLARFAVALRDGGLYVTARAHYLEVRAMPGEAREW